MLALLGCGGGGSRTTAAGRTVAQPGWSIDAPALVQSPKKWTMLVFLNAANDLETYGVLNTNQLEQLGSNDDINVVVQFKRIKGQYDSSDGDWGGTRRYFITKDNDPTHISSTILSDRNDVDMGSPQVLQDFIQWGIQTYPAQHYCLVIWNHGAGWRSVKAPGRGRGVSYDDQYQTHIDTIQLPAAMDLGGGKKWDLLAFDASLMQMAEVAYEVREKASYIVGSEESPPGTGYPYQLVLGDLVAHSDWDGKALGVAFAQEMLADNGTNSDITQSVLDTSKLSALAPALDALGTALTNAQGAYGNPISNARSAAESYAYPENHDLLDFLQHLAAPDPYTGLTVTRDPGVKSAVTQLQSATSAALVLNTQGSLHPHSNGLAVYLPTPYSYRQIDIAQANGFGQRYSTLALAKAAPGWQNFLTSGPP